MKKTFSILLGILLLFVIIYFALVQKEKRTFSPRRVENFLGLDSALVDRIEFGKFDTRMVFQKINQQWHLVVPDSFRADNNAIGQLLSAASHLEVGEVISSNPQKQLLFQVDTLTGTRLDFFSGETQLASVVVGKMTGDFLHSYLRKTDSDDVYLAKGLITRIANRRIDQWRDRSIFTFDPNQIVEIELSKDRKKFKLTKEDTLWQLSLFPYRKSSQADGEAVQAYVNTLANMKADAFPRKPEVEKVDFKKPQLTLKLTFIDGHEEKLLAVRREKEDNRYFVKTEQDENIFILFEYNFNRLAKSFEDFQPKEET